MALPVRVHLFLLVSMVTLTMVISATIHQDEHREVEELAKALIDVIDEEEAKELKQKQLSSVCGEATFSDRSLMEDELKRILNGQQATEGMWPWQVLIYVTFSDGGVGECGGSLISEDWVISAAHCFEYTEKKELVTDGSQVRMFFGASEKNQLEKNHETRTASQVIMHPEYPVFNTGVSPNDLTLLKLSSPVVLNDFVKLVCLPSADFPVDTICSVSGWGKTHFSADTSPVLMHVTQTIISNEECNTMWDGGVTEDTVCGITKGKLDTTCQGDSGGPFVCDRDGVFELAGVVSWGGDCGRENESLPSVYARVNYFLDWIYSIMSQY